jgi:hypothetical protein
VTTAANETIHEILRRRVANAINAPHWLAFYAFNMLWSQRPYEVVMSSRALRPFIIVRNGKQKGTNRQAGYKWVSSPFATSVLKRFRRPSDQPPEKELQ